MGRKRHPVPAAKTPEAQLEILRQVTTMLGGEVKVVA